MAFDIAKDTKQPVGVTAPKGPLGFWGSYRAARRNVLELIPEVAYRERVIADPRRGRWIMLMDPEGIERVMRAREPDYPKSAILIRLMTPREGQSLITTDGPVWQRQRKALAVPFRPRALRAIGPMIEDAGTAAVRTLATARGVTDVFPVVARASCDVMCDIALSGREAIDRDALRGAVDGYVAGIGRVSLFDVLGVPNWVPRPAGIFDRSRKRMDDLADAIIAARVARGPSDGAPDLLDLLLEAHSDGTLDALEVRNNLLGFLFAGHETTALAVTWALYLLAFAPDQQTRVRDEIKAVCGDTTPTIEAYDKLPFTKRVVEEALRLYPPAGFLTRTARRDDQISGHDIRAGATVIIPVYALHRHETLWDAPSAFDPDRFAPDRAEGRPRGAYLPFGDGPRICVGASLAMAEAVMILAALVQSLHFALPDGATPRPVMWFTLRPADGMKLDVRPV